MALRVGIGLASEDNPFFSGKFSAVKALNSLGVDVPEFGIAFSYHEYPPYQVYDGIKSSIGEKNLVVVNSQANILDTTIKKRGVNLALFAGHSFHYAITLVNNVKSNPYLGGHHLAWGLLNVLGEKTKGKESLKKVVIIFVSDSFIEKTEFLKGMQEVLGLKFPIVGGTISTYSPFKPGNVTFNREGTNDSAVGILLGGENLIVGIGGAHGWIPLGLPTKIKKIDRNRIQDLQHITPLKYYSKYVGGNLSMISEESKTISTIYPLGIELKNEENNYIIRFPRNFEAGGATVIDCIESEGENIRLMMGNREELLQATQQALFKALQPFEEENTLPIFLLLISAIERRELLGTNAIQELNMIKRKVSEHTKIFGIYTHGQIGPLGGIQDLKPMHYQNGAIIILAVGLRKI